MLWICWPPGARRSDTWTWPQFRRSLQFEEGIEKTIRWYLDNQAWLDNVTSGDYQKYYEEMYKGR